MSIKIRKPGNKATIVIRRSPATMTNSCTDQVHYTAKAFGSKGLFSSGSPEMNFLHALLRLLQLAWDTNCMASLQYDFPLCGFSAASPHDQVTSVSLSSWTEDVSCSEQNSDMNGLTRGEGVMQN